MTIPSHLEGSAEFENANPERASYWRDFYDRLAEFEETILAQMLELSRNMPEDQRRIVDETNIMPLRSLIDDFKRRRDLWAQKQSGPSQGAG